MPSDRDALRWAIASLTAILFALAPAAAQESERLLGGIGQSLGLAMPQTGSKTLAIGDTCTHRGGPLSEGQSMMVSTVDRNAKRLLSLVEDLLSLSRIEAGDARPELAPTDLASLVRANTAIQDAARKSDIACAQVLPKDLGEWRPTVEFVLGPYGCSKELAEVSAADFSRSGERDNSAFCRQGFGALLAKLAAPLPLLLATPVKVIEWWWSR